MQPDVWEMSTGVHHAPHLRAALRAPHHRETTRSNAIAHVIYTSRTNRFPVNCPARRTHRHFDYIKIIIMIINIQQNLL